MSRRVGELGRREVHVWLAHPDEMSERDLLRDYESLLSAGERERLERLSFERHRRERLISTALVRTTLSRYADVEPGAWIFERNEHGRPALAPGQSDAPLQFNLSHTTSLVACAVTLEREIGIDVEDTQRPRAKMSIADRYFSELEARAIHALPEEQRAQRFFEYWTLKESYVKARGMGLALPLRKFYFDLAAADGPIRIGFEPGFDDSPESWQFALFQPRPHHVMALSIRRGEGADLTIEVRKTVPRGVSAQPELGG